VNLRRQQDAHPHQGQGEVGQTELRQRQGQEPRQESQQAGGFPNGVDQPNLGGVDANLLHREVVEGGLPDAVPQGPDKVAEGDGDEEGAVAGHRVVVPPFAGFQRDLMYRPVIAS